MTNAPEEIRLWRNEPNGEWVISGPDQVYPTGSPAFVRAALTPQPEVKP